MRRFLSFLFILLVCVVCAPNCCSAGPLPEDGSLLAAAKSREAAIADHLKHYRMYLQGTYELKGYFSGSDRKGNPDYTGTVRIWEAGGQMNVEWTWANGGAQGVGMLGIPCYHEGQVQQVLFSVGTLGRDKNVGVAVYNLDTTGGRDGIVSVTLGGEWKSAGRSGYERLERRAFKGGAQVPGGYINFHLVVAKGDYAKMKEMVGADPSLVNKKDPGGATALSYVAGNGNIEAAKFLISKGADVNAGSPLRNAAREGRRDMIEFLLSQGATLKSGRNTVLMEAVGRGHRNVAELLVSRGEDVNAVDEDGWSVLMHATGSPDINMEVVRFLVLKGARVNYKNKKGETALKFANTLPGHEDIIEFLEQHGAKE
ncbi:MAG: ankyrin repeat domain-containing protein [Candidatus Eremiobacteraeota bacterium]|nr:ankyrin repeat domain-containing protein [Candidatus Eremiobacteraeota bacterium]